MQGDLPAFWRWYSAAERTAVRLLLGSGWLRARLGRSRSAAVDGRPLEPDVAAMLALDDFDGRSDLRALSPGQARRAVARSIAVVGPAKVPGVRTEDREV